VAINPAGLSMPTPPPTVAAETAADWRPPAEAIQALAALLRAMHRRQQQAEIAAPTAPVRPARRRRKESQP
jgi:hypothetical protein